MRCHVFKTQAGTMSHKVVVKWFNPFGQGDMSFPQWVLFGKTRAEVNPPCHDESYFGVEFAEFNLGIGIAQMIVMGTTHHGDGEIRPSWSGGGRGRATWGWTTCPHKWPWSSPLFLEKVHPLFQQLHGLIHDIHSTAGMDGLCIHTCTRCSRFIWNRSYTK